MSVIKFNSFTSEKNELRFIFKNKQFENVSYIVFFTRVTLFVQMCRNCA